jgi:hypothetical protein
LTADDPAASEPSEDELERVRQVLDDDADLEESDLSEEEQELLHSIEDRVEAPDAGNSSGSGLEESEEEAVTSLGEAGSEEGSPEVETTEDAVEPLHSAPETTEQEESYEDAVDPASPGGPDEASIDAGASEPSEPPTDEGEPDEDEAGTDPLSEQAEQALEAANRRPSTGSARSQLEPGGSGLGIVSPFTVVAPPQGSIQGDWVVEGHEDDQLGGGGGLDLEEDEDLEDPFATEDDEDETEEAVPDWPEEDEGDELPDEAEAEPWPDEDEFEDTEDEEPVEAEAEPEQDTVEDEDEEFWEDLLEDEDDEAEREPEPTDAEEDEEPVFEDADDWLDEEDDEEPVFDDDEDWLEDDEPATEGERAREEREAWIEESLDEEAADEEEVEFNLSGGGADTEDEADEVEFSLSGDEGDEDPSDQTLGAEAMTADGGEETADRDDAYTHGPYTLYRKTVEGSEGEEEDLFFFAREAPDDAEAAELPEGHEVGVNERTGVPFVREADED